MANRNPFQYFIGDIGVGKDLLHGGPVYWTMSFDPSSSGTDRSCIMYKCPYCYGYYHVCSEFQSKPDYGGIGTVKEKEAQYKPVCPCGYTCGRYIRLDGKAMVEFIENPGIEKTIKQVWTDIVTGHSDRPYYISHSKALDWLVELGIEECHWPQWAKEAKQERDRDRMDMKEWKKQMKIMETLTGKGKPVDQWTWQELMEYLSKAKAEGRIYGADMHLGCGTIELVMRGQRNLVQFKDNSLCNALKKAVKWLKEQGVKPKPVEEIPVYDCLYELSHSGYIIRKSTDRWTETDHGCPTFVLGVDSSLDDFTGVQLRLSGEDYTDFVHRCLRYAREHPLTNKP
jgi:hypothetical protein